MFLLITKSFTRSLMGTLFSSQAKTRKRGIAFASSSSKGQSSTTAVMVFWKGKDGIMPIDDTWPIITHQGTLYEGHLGYSGVVHVPWLRDLISPTCQPPPANVIGAAYDPPTLEIQRLAPSLQIGASFKTRHLASGDLVMVELERYK